MVGLLGICVERLLNIMSHYSLILICLTQRHKTISKNNKKSLKHQNNFKQ